MMRNYLLEHPVKGSISTQKYLCHIHWRNGVLIMDEPANIGGKDLGPDPYTTLLASLAGCTLSTLRMYIDRKEWDIKEIHILVNMYQEDKPEFSTIITREITFGSEVDEVTRARLLAIAEKCPVSKILKSNIQINTNINHG